MRESMAVVEEQIVVADEWRGLYSESWKGVIVDDAFAHPAKFSRALIRKIYDHVIAEGWATKGDSVVDPFGGVALGGLDAMRHGLNWYGCELEQKFVELGGRNIALWNERYSRMPNWGTARLLQGDSRKLEEVFSAANCCISSPPYAGGCAHNGGDDPKPENLRGGDYHSVGLHLGVSSPPYAGYDDHGGRATAAERDRRRLERLRPDLSGRFDTCFKGSEEYGQTEGQLGAMREGDHSIAISSPPYVGSLANAKNYADPEKAKADSEREFMQHRSSTYADLRYGDTEGNLGAMPEGQLCVSSPPYEGIRQDGAGIALESGNGFGAYTDEAADLWHTQRDQNNIGNLKTGETFWSASRLILEQLHQVLTPDAHAVFVVKSFVRDKKIVDFPAQWAQLCEAVGFKLLHDHHALLTEEHGKQDTLTGEGQKARRTVERKSFFRRLAEQKGSPRIDYENVLCFRKVA